MNGTGAIRYLLGLAFSLCLSMGIAHGDTRVALVIGNGAYENAPALANPANDAEDISAALGRLGFMVLVERNLSKRSLEGALARFSRLAEGADAAMFFYA